ncbi:uncharacterized protein LOC132197534 isoform X2 [Neocloeon triangulifer]|uniref:uncharacterized protein LOC132197534 isoform X2 n=1 Tax=Neocloeon triangulifer TaxID=2078957 RepID=UPI00286EC3C1|nr:uncharacterized protein LOC132197534 isoform X2 [Neocloeon triangulifer]
MASSMDTATFFSKGTPEQYKFVLSMYTDALRLKCELKKVKKPEELMRLDKWYQHELPKVLKSRGKDRHLNHEELVQAMKWKLARGKFYPQLSYLIKVNTPKAVMSETKKAFKKLPNLESAITALTNLKGVGTTMASALLAAACPEEAPFMADECLMAIPDFEGIDYTTREYLNFVQHIKTVVDRLNKDNPPETPEEDVWNPHKVELALWSHYILSVNKPELLEEAPKNGNSHHTPANGISKPDESISDDSTQDTSSKDSPAPTGIIVSPEDSLLEPPTEDSMDANTGNDEESSSQDTPEEAKEESQPAAAAPAPEPIVAEKEPEPAAEEPKQVQPDEPKKEVEETTTTTDAPEKEAAIEEEPAAKRPKVDGDED